MDVDGLNLAPPRVEVSRRGEREHLAEARLGERGGRRSENEEGPRECSRHRAESPGHGRFSFSSSSRLPKWLSQEGKRGHGRLAPLGTSGSRAAGERRSAGSGISFSKRLRNR